MKRITLHVIRAKDAVEDIPPLELDGLPLAQWFANATADELRFDVQTDDSPFASAHCDGRMLTRILRGAVFPPSARPVDEIAVLFCRNWRVPEGFGNLYGLMFDFDASGTPLGDFHAYGAPREACAVFLDPFGPDRAEDVVFTAIHELGHVFNLGHDHTNRSFMAPSDWTHRRFLVEDAERLRLACRDVEPHRWRHLPGGANYDDPDPTAGGPYLRRDAAGPKARSLVLTAELGRGEYLLGETVTLDLRLAPRGATQVPVPSDFDPGHPAMRIWYQTPEGEQRLHRSPYVFCRYETAEVTVTPSRPLEHNPRITFGRNGLNFVAPGRYAVWAEFDLSGGRWTDVVCSNVVEFLVYLPRNTEDAAISRTLADPAVGLFVAQKGGALPDETRQRLSRLAYRHRRHPSMRPVRYAQASRAVERRRPVEAAELIRNLHFSEHSLAEGADRIRRAAAKEKRRRT